MTLPQLHLATWDEIESKVEEYRNVFKDLNNYLFIDYETFYSDEYSLRKKDMTYLKFIRHEFFKIQSAFIKRGDGEGVYLKTVADIEDYLKQQLEEYPDTIICAQQVFFDGGIIRYFHNLEFKYALDLPSMSRSIWPNDMFHNLDAIAERLWPDDQSKRKSDDIAFTKGVYNWSEEIHERNYLYNKQDTELLAEIVTHFVKNGFPIDVLVQHSIILMMYLKPRFKGDKALLEMHLRETIADQEQKLSAAIDYIKKNSNLRGAFFVTTEERNKEKFKTQKAYDEAYRSVFGMPPMKTKKDLRLMLSSNDKFAMVLQKGFGIDPPMKPSPSKPDEFTYAFGKNDVEFQQLMALHRDLKVIWEGRMVSKSNQERTRTETFLEYMDLCDGFIPVPLRPSAAHTHRLGGTEAINMQNLGRNSPLRHALTGGGTHAVNATDSSNIESRMSAVFCGHTEKVELFINNGDPYNDMATTIYGYEVDRKSKTVDHKMQGAVGKATDLGCGYQMGEGRFRSYLNSGPLGMPPIYLEDLPEFANMANPYKYIIDVYREKNWPIRDMWWKLQNMLSEMQYHYCDEEVGGFVRFTHECIWLPSGLRLHYPDLHRTKEGTMYRNPDGWNFIFGGKVLENIIQALSAVIILRQMVWVAAYLEIVYTWEQAAPALQVHDEIVSVFPINEGYEVVDGEAVWKKDGQVRKTEEDLCAIMHRRPDSFEAVPIAAEGGTDLRYSK